MSTMSQAKRKHSEREEARDGLRRRSVAARLRARLPLYLIVVLALQGIVAQAHVHFHLNATSAYAGARLDAPPSDGANTPTQGSRGDTASCALCQSLTAGAAPLHHEAPSALQLAVAHWPPSQRRASPARLTAVSFSWTSRGPPRPTPLLS